MDTISHKITEIAEGLFSIEDLQKFINQFTELCTNENEIKAHILQISRDEGCELEIGFLTETNIVDITLSKGKVYSCEYPVCEIQKTEIIVSESKTTLQIQGRKKFDYNVLKPESIVLLMEYKSNIDQLLKSNF